MGLETDDQKKSLKIMYMGWLFVREHAYKGVLVTEDNIRA